MATGTLREWLVLRHLEHEHIGTIAAVLEERRESWRYVDLHKGEAVPKDSSAYIGVIVMGGSMGVYETDKFPFLLDEQALIRKSAEAGQPVLGICLGSQLIASAFGARVFPSGKKEIGWFEIEKTAADPWTSSLPSRLFAFHWHGDTFDLPGGAVRLFRSEMFENQAFRIGSNVLALQFHFEVNSQMANEWLDDEGCKKEIASVPSLSPGAIRFDTIKRALTQEMFGKCLFRDFFNSFSSK